MPLPHHRHLLNRNSLRLREEEDDESRHCQRPTGKKEEQPELKAAKKSQECLRDGEGEEHADGNRNAEPRWSNRQWEALGHDEQPHRPPGPGETGDVDADEDHHGEGVGAGDVALAGNPEDDGDQGADDYLTVGFLIMRL